MSELHWLTITSATVGFVLLKGGVFTAEEAREWVQDRDLSTLHEASELLQSSDPTKVSRGLRLISNGVIDWKSLGIILAVLLEEMVMGNLSVRKVVGTLQILDKESQCGELILDSEVVGDFTRDDFSLGMLPSRLDAIDSGDSEESLEELQEDVDRWLSCYASL